MTDAELISHLRRAASTWFKNSDLLLLEELIKRYRNLYHAVESMQTTNRRMDGRKHESPPDQLQLSPKL
jgi:hypothetical protein